MNMAMMATMPTTIHSQYFDSIPVIDIPEPDGAVAVLYATLTDEGGGVAMGVVPPLANC